MVYSGLQIGTVVLWKENHINNTEQYFSGLPYPHSGLVFFEKSPFCAIMLLNTLELISRVRYYRLPWSTSLSDYF